MRRHSQGDQEPPVAHDAPSATPVSRPSAAQPGRPKLPLSGGEPTQARLDGFSTLRMAGGSAKPQSPSTTALHPHEAPLSPASPDTLRDVRAPRPSPAAEGSHVEAMGTLLGDLDAAFGAIVDPTIKGPSTHPPVWPATSSMAEVRELFSALAANHMRQVRDFMIGVRWGEAHREWAAICEPAVLSLVGAAQEMDMEALRGALEDYAAVLRKAAASSDAMLSGATRDELIGAYQRLTEHMPEVFALEGERDRREAIIVHALLQQVPEVHKLTIDRMYAAGLTSLETLFLAKADDIAATTGIGEALASLVVAKFQEYKRDAARCTDPSRGVECERIQELAQGLREVHERFESLAHAWGDQAHEEKKRARRMRTELLLSVKVLLARLGEVDRIAALERLPFARKIEHLEAFAREVLKQQPGKSSPSKFAV
jgi:hypothetical protein